MVFGEFMEMGNESLVISYNVLQNCVNNPPEDMKGGKVAFCDFAAGGDENVLCVKEGNRIHPMVCWKERDTMSAVGRFIIEFKRFGLKAHEVYADAGGLGIPMCDALSEAGWDVNRVNNGEKARDSQAA
jgi:predicted oxidoreductase